MIIAGAVVVIAVVGVFVVLPRLRAVRNEIDPYDLNVGAPNKVFIATEASDWKTTLLTTLGEDLSDLAMLHVDNLAMLGELDVNEWDAVVVIASIYMKEMQTDAEKFLTTLEDDEKGKVILMTTSGTSSPDDYGIYDAITSASMSDEGIAGALVDQGDPIAAAGSIGESLRGLLN